VKRREFITLVGGAVAAWPVMASAQQPAGKPPIIGYIGGGARTSQQAWLDAFMQRLRERGWIEGRTVTIEVRWGEGRTERYTEIAAEFVRLNVNVILAGGTEAAVAAKQVTSTIPIVFPTAVDPVGSKLVVSLARPGGNVTGLSNLGTDLAAKRLEILREAFPELRQLATLLNTDYSGGVTETGEVQAAAAALGLEIIPLPIRRVETSQPPWRDSRAALRRYIQPATRWLTRSGCASIRLRSPRASRRWFSQRQYLEVGGLMSYGPNFLDLNRRSADYVDKILRGATPADLPVEQPTKFELIINLKSAKALGIDVPTSLIARADEVIE
jgi:putative tryptophan/tyrosine transport system substrate-binding protein